MKQLYAHSHKVRSYALRSPPTALMDIFADARVSLVVRDEADRPDQRRLADGFAEFVVVEFSCHTAGSFSSGTGQFGIGLSDLSSVYPEPGRIVLDILAHGDLFATLAAANEAVLKWEQSCGGQFHARLMESKLRDEVMGDAR